MDSSTLMLLQEPQQWRPAHLKAAKVQVTQGVPVTSLVEPHFIPRDGDEGFENLAEVLCRATRADKTALAGMGEMSLEDMESHVQRARNGLVDIVDLPEAGDMDDRAAALRRVLGGAARSVNGGEELHTQTGTAFQFHVPPLKVWAQIEVGGAVLEGNHGVFDRTDAPLAAFSVIPGGISDRSKMAKFEVPQALFQAVMTYNQNPYLVRYEGYVITLEGSVLRISRAAMSRAYMERLCQGQSLSEPLELCRSEAFELLDPGGRREFVRAAMGLFFQTSVFM